MTRGRMKNCWRGVGLVALLSGCQHMDRARECREVSKLVNPVLSAVEAERIREPGSAPVYRAIALQYESLASALGKPATRAKRLQDTVVEYQKVLHEAGRDARVFSDALESKDAARIDAARAAGARTVKHEATAVARLDAVCRGK
jgi:hypothetical protein